MSYEGKIVMNHGHFVHLEEEGHGDKDPICGEIIRTDSPRAGTHKLADQIIVAALREEIVALRLKLDGADKRVDVRRLEAVRLRSEITNLKRAIVNLGLGVEEE